MCQTNKWLIYNNNVASKWRIDKIIWNKEAFFLRDTARLPSSTSQLVLFHHHFWEGGGSSSVSISGEFSSLSTSRGWGVLFHLHFWGVLFHVHFKGSFFHVYFWGGSHVTYPIMLLYTTIEHPSTSWAKFTWDPPPPRVEQTDKHEWKHYLPTH